AGGIRKGGGGRWVSPTRTALRLLKRALPAITRTPSPVKRSLESLGAIAAITPCTRSWTLPKSTAGGGAESPNADACAMARARLPAAISDFDGMQPVLRQSPPTLPFPTTTPETPKAAARAAPDSPPGPAPMTQRSGFKSSGMARRTKQEGRRTPDHSAKGATECSSAGRPAPAVRRRPCFEALHRDRDERQHPERHQRGEQLRRERRSHVEREPAGGMAVRRAG